MTDKAQSIDAASSDDTPVTPTAAVPRRGPGHRGADVRDTVAEMAARAHEISQEAGSKMAAAMKDVINAAAGLAGFAVESARDLVQFMVRRGQMTQEEGDRLLRDAEEAYAKRRPAAPAAATGSSNGDAPTAPAKAAATRGGDGTRAESAKGAAGGSAATKPAAKQSATKPAAAKAPAKAAAKSPAKAAAKSPPKSSAKSPAKSPAKKSAPAKKTGAKRK